MMQGKKRWSKYLQVKYFQNSKQRLESEIGAKAISSFMKTSLPTDSSEKNA
jgi:hypothetical protein